MGDDNERKKRGTGAGDENSQYPALGVVFLGVGVVFMITMESAALGLPFLALGIAFFAMGVSAVKKKKSTDDTNDDAPSP